MQIVQNSVLFIVNCLISQSCENGDGDNDDDCTEGIGDCDDDHDMKMIILIVRKKSKDIRACGPDMLQLTFCVCLFTIKRKSSIHCF